MNEFIDKYINKLKTILEKNNVCKSHGINHAISVMEHSKKSIEYENNLTEIEKEAIIIASLLHDADDKKFFPNNNDNENTRFILNDKSQEFINLVVKMIDLVSASKNKDNIPEDIKNKKWMLIPRYCDRLEAIGYIGILRCYQYNQTSNKPLYTQNTQKATNIEEVYKIATIERYNKYNGISESMIDHYYDKLLRTHLFQIDNKYLLDEAQKRQNVLVDFVIEFGKNGFISDEKIKVIEQELTKL